VATIRKPIARCEPSCHRSGEMHNFSARALYHLGYVNYQLAEKGEPNRVFEALKFNQECAQIRGNYQEQAAKNILSIKSEFNIP